MGTKTQNSSKSRQSFRPIMEHYSCKPSINKSFIKSDGTSSLFLLVYINKTKVTIPIGISWDPLFFDINEGKLLPRGKRDSLYLDYNIIIQSELAKVNEIFKNFRLNDQILTPEEFKNQYNGYESRKDYNQFYKSALYARVRHKEIEFDTFKTQQTTLNSLMKFRKSIPFNEIGRELIKQYMFYLKSCGCSDNTIWARCKDLKTYMNIAKREGINFVWPFDKLSANEKPKYRNTNKTFLNKTEVQELYELLIGGSLAPWHQTVLAKYLFSCFTGIRISDTNRFNEFEFTKDEIVFVMHKNKTRLGKIVRIPLSAIAKDILRNYHQSLMTTYSDPVINRELKIISKKTSIKKKLTFHTARHTFATLFLEMGGTVEVLSDILGHSSIKTTMIYVHITSENRKKQMMNMDNLFK